MFVINMPINNNDDEDYDVVVAAATLMIIIFMKALVEIVFGNFVMIYTERLKKI